MKWGSIVNKYLKNGLIIILVAVLGGVAGFGLSELLAKDKPGIEIKQQTIHPISKAEVLKMSKYPVITPSDYFKNKNIKYYIFPDQRTKVDYVVSNEPVASLDIATSDKIDISNWANKGVTVSSSFGAMHIFQDKNQSFIWFDQNKIRYLLVVQNKILPKDKAKALIELKKVTTSFKNI